MIQTKVGETMSEELAIRRIAIHLLRSGKAPMEVAQEVRRSVAWVYKWRKRYSVTNHILQLQRRRPTGERQLAQQHEYHIWL